MNQETLTRAWEVLQDAYQAQMEGDYDRAVELYQSSLELHPTAEAHTFLGWTYHFQGKLIDAISECKRAIELDPDFGNPYNDIGAYMIELAQFDHVRANIVVRVAKIRVQFDGPFAFRNRVDQFALKMIRPAQKCVRLCGGVQFQSRLVQLH